jgi:hypothetical protein
MDRTKRLGSSQKAAKSRYAPVIWFPTGPAAQKNAMISGSRKLLFEYTALRITAGRHGSGAAVIATILSVRRNRQAPTRSTSSSKAIPVILSPITAR